MDKEISYTAKRLAIYDFLAAVATTLPDKEFTDRIAGFCAETQDIKPGITRDSGKLFCGLERWANFASQARCRDRNEAVTELAVDWTRLFRGIKLGYGPPPARASAYIECDVEELVQLYRAAGLQPADSRFDPDYIGIQLAFMAKLVNRELAALQVNDRSSAERSIREQQEFAYKHLAWIPAYCAAALPHAGTDFYYGALLFLEGFYALEQEWLRADFVLEGGEK